MENISHAFYLQYVCQAVKFSFVSNLCMLCKFSNSFLTDFDVPFHNHGLCAIVIFH